MLLGLTCPAVLSVETARIEWERAFSELEAQRDDPRRYRRLLAAVDIVTDELRARVGQTFTVEQLVSAYVSADDWGRHAVSERAPYEGWPRDLALVEGAAFHAYVRGALDFGP